MTASQPKPTDPKNKQAIIPHHLPNRSPISEARERPEDKDPPPELETPPPQKQP